MIKPSQKTPLYKLRIELGLNQAELGEIIQLSQQSASRIENGKRQLPPNAAKLLIGYAKEKGLSVGFTDIYGL
jgi:transcriptional regulator with XRE-family HTH domain